MFRFNFALQGGETTEASDALEATTDEGSRRDALRRSEELRPSSSSSFRHRMAFMPFPLSENVSIHRAANPVVDADAHAHASTSESDLVRGVYEGGFKVWECSIDLSRFIANSTDVASSFTSDTRVIELGCGQGLVGITALALGVGKVDFQDYDATVVRDLTAPVVEENIMRLTSSSSKRRARFFAGDWGTLAEDILRPQGLLNSYDVVLTTETIYDEVASVRLLACIKACLKPEGSVCYLAAKSFYFGVGGGIAGFQKLVERDGTFQHRILHTIDDGKSNRREILELRNAYC